MENQPPESQGGAPSKSRIAIVFFPILTFVYFAVLLFPFSFIGAILKDNGLPTLSKMSFVLAFVLSMVLSRLACKQLWPPKPPLLQVGTKSESPERLRDA